FQNFDFVFPVHLNPNIQSPVMNILGSSKNVYLLAPQEYLPFVKLMSKCTLILTDSGGIQEEAPSLNKLVLVMRETTERPEAISSGAVKLVGSKKDDIVRNFETILLRDLKDLKIKKLVNPYGDGKASERILDFILKSL